MTPSPLLQASPFAEDAGRPIGRAPDDLSPADWQAAGVVHRTAMAAIRAKCLDCAGSQSEVRKCVVTSCPLWPLRLGRYAKGLISPDKGKSKLGRADPDNPVDNKISV